MVILKEIFEKVDFEKRKNNNNKKTRQNTIINYVSMPYFVLGFTLFGASSNKEILPEYYKLPHDHKQADNSLVDQGLKEVCNLLILQLSAYWIILHASEDFSGILLEYNQK